MTSVGEVRTAMLAKAKELGKQVDPKSGLNKLDSMTDMVNIVKAKMKVAGIGEEHLIPVMTTPATIQALTKKWHGMATEASRIIERYLKVNPTAGDTHPPNDHEDHTTEGDPVDDQSDEPQPVPRPSDGEGNGEGDGDGDGNGEGDGDGQIIEETDEESHDEGEGFDRPIPDHEEEHQDEDDPDDPTYIKPKIWNDLLRVLRWNKAHPGKQKNIYICGPRGTGKTELVIQLCKKVFGELPHTITSPQAKHEVSGYGDAQGRYVATQFTDGYTKEGVVLIEEMDRAEPKSLIAINSATANKIMDTPVVGMIEQHPGCTIIATANTSGTGATTEYVTAEQLDASTLDRYVAFLMEWDHEIALKIGGDLDLVLAIEAWNKSCEANGLVSDTASYRAVKDIKDLVEMGFDYKRALEAGLLKYRLSKPTLSTIYDGLEDKKTKFSKTIKQIVDEMPDIGMI